MFGISISTILVAIVCLAIGAFCGDIWRRKFPKSMAVVDQAGNMVQMKINDYKAKYGQPKPVDPAA